MAYNKTIWQNEPNQTSPLSAENLNKIEEGIYDNDLAITDLVDNKVIVESDSNANGSYIKYADGTLMCYSNVTIPDKFAYGNGTFDDPYRSDVISFTFAKPFLVEPIIDAILVIVAPNGPASAGFATVRSVTTSGGSLQVFFLTNSTAAPTSMEVHITAKERWK